MGLEFFLTSQLQTLEGPLNQKGTESQGHRHPRILTTRPGGCHSSYKVSICVPVTWAVSHGQKSRWQANAKPCWCGCSGGIWVESSLPLCLHFNFHYSLNFLICFPEGGSYVEGNGMNPTPFGPAELKAAWELATTGQLIQKKTHKNNSKSQTRIHDRGYLEQTGFLYNHLRNVWFYIWNQLGQGFYLAVLTCKMIIHCTQFLPTPHLSRRLYQWTLRCKESSHMEYYSQREFYFNMLSP